MYIWVLNENSMEKNISGSKFLLNLPLLRSITILQTMGIFIDNAYAMKMYWCLVFANILKHFAINLVYFCPGEQLHFEPINTINLLTFFFLYSTK